MDLHAIQSHAWGLVGDKRFYMVLIVTILLIIAALYVWRNYVTPRLNRSYVPNKEYTNKHEMDEDANEADLYFFFTEWCPHCKSARPQWNQFKDLIGEKKINGVKINFIEIDCDKDTATANRFKVDGYPTIKLVYKEKIIEYDAKPNAETLQQFLNVSL